MERRSRVTASSSSLPITAPHPVASSSVTGLLLIAHHRWFPLGRPPPPAAPLHPDPYKSLSEDPRSILHLIRPSPELLPLSPFTSTELHRRHSLLFANSPSPSLRRPVKSSVSSVQPSSSRTSQRARATHIASLSKGNHRRHHTLVASRIPSLPGRLLPMVRIPFSPLFL
jgi:hypothetical protein